MLVPLLGNPEGGREEIGANVEVKDVVYRKERLNLKEASFGFLLFRRGVEARLKYFTNGIKSKNPGRQHG